MTAGWLRCHDLARRDGPVAALAELYRAVPAGAVLVGPAGHAVRPGPAGPAEAVVTPEPLRRAGLVVVRARPASARPDPATYRCWLVGLSWLRLGVSAGLLDAARGHLSGRLAGRQPLLHQQLVKGELADAVIEQLDLRAGLAGLDLDRPAGDRLADLHRRITGTDRAVLRLLGAAGFTVDGPGLAGYLSELLADVYLTS